MRLTTNKKVKSKLIMAAGVLSASFAAQTITSAALALQPKLVKAEAPVYPRAAMRRNLEGVVVLDLAIDDGGNVLNAQVIEAEVPGVFDKSAIKAAMQWKYAPGTPTDGHRAEIKFKLAQ